MPEPLLDVEHVTHRPAAHAPPVLHDVSLTAEPGTLVALAGRSGSGKSTLCHLVAGVGRPTEGSVRVAGRPADEVRDWALVSLLPQRLALVEELSVAENATLPQRLHADAVVPDGWSGDLLDSLDLGRLGGRLVTQTSLGEQQRTAIARALALVPRLAVLDEPTGHQDDEHVELVVAALRLAREHGSALLVATHDERLLDVADRVVRLHQGVVVG
ncbi:ABC transporter ATP-binding protein [Angustibacter aerolatus]